MGKEQFAVDVISVFKQVDGYVVYEVHVDDNMLLFIIICVLQTQLRQCFNMMTMNQILS